MKLDGNFYKREISERTTPAELEKKSIQNYLISKFGLNEHISKKVSIVLERTNIDTKKVSSGYYDKVIQYAITEVTKREMDAQHIREQENKENVTSEKSANQNNEQEMDNQKEFEEKRRKAIEEMERLITESQIQFQSIHEELRANRLSGHGRK